MKKFIFFILCLLSIFFITSCSTSGLEINPSSESGTDQMSEIENNPSTDSGTDLPSEIEIGMTRSDFKMLTEGTEVFNYIMYSFFQDQEGQDVTILWGNNGTTIAKINRVPHVVATVEGFRSLEAGMDVFEVVNRIGLPFDSFTSGMITMAFQFENGQVYQAYWNTRKNENDQLTELYLILNKIS